MTCNDACFNKLFNKLKSDKLSIHERQDHCNSLHSVGGSLMYSTLCRNILSDIREHRAVADKNGVSYRESLCSHWLAVQLTLTDLLSAQLKFGHCAVLNV